MTATTDRTRVRRTPARGVYERAAIDAILDEALVGHLGFAAEGQPYVIPMLLARVQDIVYVHGSTASRLVRALSAGTPACLTATLVDGLVLARSAFHHSLNYRSVVVLGPCTLVEGDGELQRALHAFTEKLVPGRWDEVRPPSRQERTGTRVLAMRLDECSAKARTGPPVDDEDDYALPVWAGVLPLSTHVSAPIDDPRLTAGVVPSEVVTGWRPPRRTHPPEQRP